MARRAFYREAMAEHGLQAVATGHTKSDQAEPVLYRLMRGAGTMGLAGIAPVTAEGLIRPLIEFERPELIAWLLERGLPWREDASNADRNFVRNRIRHELLPALSKDYNPRIGEALANLATLARDEEFYWSAEVDRIAADMFTRQNGAVILSTAALAGMPRAVSRRVVRKGIREVKGDLRGIDFDHVERVLGLTACEHGHGRVILSGVDIFLSFEWLRFAKPRSESRWDRNYEVSLSAPGVFEVPGQARCIELQVLEMSESGPRDGTKPGYNEDWNSLDFGRIDEPLVLRNWYPGDHFTPVGHSEDKVKLLFQQARIPIWDRQGWPIITSGDQIVWVRQFGPAAEYASGPESTRLLLISEREIIR